MKCGRTEIGKMECNPCQFVDSEEYYEKSAKVTPAKQSDYKEKMKRIKDEKKKDEEKIEISKKV